MDLHDHILALRARCLMVTCAKTARRRQQASAQGRAHDHVEEEFLNSGIILAVPDDASDVAKV